MEIRNLKYLLGGDGPTIDRMVQVSERPLLHACLLATTISCAIYGFSFGLWRGWEQAFYTGIKFPLVIFLTCLGNAFLNGLFGILLGANLSIRQSALALLISFTITSLILLSFVPVILFFLYNLPGPSHPQAKLGESILLLSHTAVIALAGCIGNVRLWQFLVYRIRRKTTATLLLGSWLAVNLLLGSQVSWILRPWIGRPEREITFFSPEPFQGNFFEALWFAAKQILPFL